MRIPLLLCFSFMMLVLPTRADNYQCVWDECHASMPAPGGTRVVKFKKGDMVSTTSGWIVNPLKGWEQVDMLKTSLLPGLI